ncbi:MFS transporter [Actinoallomurus soli]|uniref:MFS transporter n=1 Tax=Actinoallomurus soli TaxID=2952535 RepID=UPI002093E7D4|nr:MFS transporter [Actinoallomurus soli]MCO5973766.1 MFS transporter [Actinoallomurus soli]
MGRHRRPFDRQVTYHEVFGVGEFRSIWLAQTLSYIGDQLAQIALAVLVYNNTHSALRTAVAYALTYLPSIMGGPVLSVLADLLPRRRVMIVCDVARTGIVALMALHHLPFAVLCFLIFWTVLLGAPFTAARAALLTEVLPGDLYVVGSAINNITHQFTQVLGFLVGGAVIFAVGAHQALAVDAATFAISALILMAGVRARPAPRPESRERPSLWAITRDGARLVFRDRTLRPLVCFAWLCGFYVLPEGLAAPYAKTFGAGPVFVGLLMSAMPCGMVLGSLAYSRFVRPDDRLRFMGWMAMLSCAPLLGTALRPPLWAVIVLLALSGVGSAYQLAANAAYVAAVPPDGRGQAFGLAQSGILASQGIGILVGGALAQVLGPEPVVALAGIAGLSAATMLAMSWTRIRGEVIASNQERAMSAAA